MVTSVAMSGPRPAGKFLSRTGALQVLT